MDATSAEAIGGAAASTLHATETKPLPEPTPQANVAEETPVPAASAADAGKADPTPGTQDEVVGGEKTDASTDAAALADGPGTKDDIEVEIGGVVEKPAAAAVAALKESPAFTSFAQQLPDIIKEVGHDEMWGVSLAGASTTEPTVPVSIVLQKFLNANEGDLTKGIDQLKAALLFRKEKKPLDLLNKTYSKAKFGDLGAVTVYPIPGKAVPEVFTWNLYGNVKDRMDEVFVPLDE
jgi:phosphatidylinositol transfer protein SFH5